MALSIHAKKEERLPLQGSSGKASHIKYLFVCFFPSCSCRISRSLPAGKTVQATSIEELVCSDEGLECVMTEGLECAVTEPLKISPPSMVGCKGCLWADNEVRTRKTFSNLSTCHLKTSKVRALHNEISCSLDPTSANLLSSPTK